MKFGIFYEMQLPRPWGPDCEWRLYNNALDQLELADALGYDYAWEVEHHFLEEYSHSSAPGGVPRGRQPADPSASASATASSSSPPTIRPRSPRRSRCSTCSPTDASSSGMGESASITELHAVRRRFQREAGDLRGRGPLPDADVRGRRRRLPRAVLRLSRRATCCPSPDRSRTRRSGPPARSCRPSPTRARKGWARWASSSSAPTPPTPGCMPITTASPSAWIGWPTIRSTPTSRWSRCSCAQPPTRRPAPRPTARPSSSSACATTTPPTANGQAPGEVDMWVEYGKWKAANAEQAERALSGGLIGSPETHPPQAAQVRGLAHRPGDPA